MPLKVLIARSCIEQRKINGKSKMLLDCLSEDEMERYRAESKEIHRKKVKENANRNKEKVDQYHRDYYDSHKEEKSAYDREYYRKKKENVG
jgi:hypothetical protein